MNFSVLIKDYNFYLTQMYGNYMKFSSIEKQKLKHKEIRFIK